MGMLSFRRLRQREAAATTKAATSAHQALTDQIPPPADGHELPDGFISTNAHKALTTAGLTHYEQLEPLSIEQLEAVKGIGKATAQKIQAAVATWRADLDDAAAADDNQGDDEKPEGDTKDQD